jgi:SAM-dependent methyltransferase
MLFGREHITKESLDILKNITQEIDGDMSYNYPLGDIQNKILHHHNHILYDIRSLLGNEEKVYLELGTYAGGSSALLSSHPYPTKVYGVDICEVFYGDVVYDTVNRFIKPHNSFKFYEGNCQNKEFIQKLKSEIPKVDLLYIDAGHWFFDVLHDFENFVDFVNPNGYIVFDDYEDIWSSTQVCYAVDYLVANKMKDGFEIVGSLPNIQNARPAIMLNSNLFVVKKL